MWLCVLFHVSRLYSWIWARFVCNFVISDSRLCARVEFLRVRQHPVRHQRLPHAPTYSHRNGSMVCMAFKLNFDMEAKLWQQMFPSLLIFWASEMRMALNQHFWSSPESYTILGGPWWPYDNVQVHLKRGTTEEERAGDNDWRVEESVHLCTWRPCGSICWMIDMRRLVCLKLAVLPFLHSGV